MGRVYKALVKAEHWQDGDRPIGRPQRETSRGPNELPFNVSQGLPARPAVEAIGDRVAHASKGLLDTTESAGVNTATLAPRRAASVASQVTPQPASVPVITFEEPSEVQNIRQLRVDPRVATLINENSSVLERYRSLAVKLLNLAERRKLKTLLITSAEAGEGKTTIATVVAWLMAKHAERRVLLIDANASAPSIGRTLGLDAKRGWLQLADGSCELKHAIVRLNPNGLYVMTPGPLAGAQSADATTARFEDVIAKFAPCFDLVVVDGPAILESTEAQRLAEVLDGAVIVARAGHTHHGKVTAARKLVRKERRLGVVLNESDAGAESVQRRRGKSSLIGRLFGSKK